MQGVQLSIEFNPVHVIENNALSQAFLDANRFKFNTKCKEVFQRLIEGERMTVLEAANTGISSLPRRIKDLREFGIRISDNWIKKGNSEVIEYFMSAEDRTVALENLVRKIK
jgi:hypothetical protein